MKLNKDLNALQSIALQRDYLAGSALMDITGVGAIYNMGADVAQIHRLSRISEIKDPILNGYVQEYLTSTKQSLAARAAYVTSATAAITGAAVESSWLMSLGGIAAALFAALFIARAGLNASFRQPLEDLQRATGSVS